MSFFNLVKQAKDNQCAKCHKVFEVWSQYHAHIGTKVCERIKIKPLNTSGRSKAQIVAAWEAQQKPGVLIHG